MREFSLLQSRARGHDAKASETLGSNKINFINRFVYASACAKNHDTKTIISAPLALNWVRRLKGNNGKFRRSAHNERLS
jgi:hypothetical protein